MEPTTLYAFLLFFFSTGIASAQHPDTLITLQGRRIAASGTKRIFNSFVYDDVPTGTKKKIATKDVYLIRYADGRYWPESIGIQRQRQFMRTVRKNGGDTTLFRERFPLRPGPSDSVITMNGLRIPVYNVQRRGHRIAYNDARDSAAHRIGTRATYYVRFADGDIWPPELKPSHRQRYELRTARGDGDWSNFLLHYRKARHQLLVCAPGFHQTGSVPGVSVGLSFDSFVDSAWRFSVGGSLSKMWAGTPQTGKLGDGERRTNVQANIIAPFVRYHLLDKRKKADLFAGFSLSAGTYRRSDSWMTSGRYFTELPSTYLMVAPQLELGFSLNMSRSAVMQFLCAAGPQFVGGRFETATARSGCSGPDGVSERRNNDPHVPVAAGWLQQ